MLVGKNSILMKEEYKVRIKLMLIRHGKAEERTESKEDFDRTLTENGKNEFSEFTSSIQSYLSDEDSIVVWTSPLIRAKQTAEILTDTLDTNEAVEKEFIPSGDFDQLLNELNTLDNGSTVICIGHKPHLGNWVEKLIGAPFSFSKGGVAVLQIDLNDEDNNTLIWKNSPKFSEKDEDTEEVREILLEQVEIMESTYLNFSNNPYKPKTTHKIRVSMRTMRALLNFLKPVIGKIIYKEINDELKEAANLLEDLREIDVLIKECSKVAFENPRLISNYADIFSELRIERRRILRSATSKTTNQKLKSTIEFTREKIESLPLYLENSSKKNWQKMLTERLKKKKKKVKKGYSKLDISDSAQSHELRKDAKKLRYSADAFDKLTTKNGQKIHDNAEDIQDELGNIRDHYINSKLLKELAEETDKEDLKPSFRTLSRFEKEKSMELVREKS